MGSEMNEAGPLLDRVAIVTGSSRGIGREIAIHLASLGARVVVNYSSNSVLADSVASQINASWTTSPTTATTLPRAVVVGADVSDEDQVKALFDAAERIFKSPVHILVHNAAVLDNKFPFIVDTSVESFDTIFRVNARGTFLCCREGARRLKKGGGGRIITLSSSLAGVLKPSFGAYTSTKAAIEAMTKILAKELKGTAITANCVAPGPIATEMFLGGMSEEEVQKRVEESPMSRIGVTEDVAPVIGFLATDAAEWVNGQVIRVNGGFV